LTLLTPVHKDGFPETMQDMFQSYFVCVCRQSDAAGLVGVTARPLGVYIFLQRLPFFLFATTHLLYHIIFFLHAHHAKPHQSSKHLFHISSSRRRPAQSSMYPISNFEALAIAHYPRFTEKDIFDERSEMGWLYLHPDDIRGFRVPWKELTLVMQPADPTASFEEHRKKTTAKIEAYYAFLESGSGSHPTFTLFMPKADNRSAGHNRTSAEENSDTRQPLEKKPIMIKEEYEQVNARIKARERVKESTSCWITPSALTKNTCLPTKGGWLQRLLRSSRDARRARVSQTPSPSCSPQGGQGRRCCHNHQGRSRC
jgi:hypothetical protein